MEIIRLLHSKLVWRRVFLMLGIALCLYFFLLVRPVLPPFLASLVLAYVLNPLVRYLERRRLSRVMAIFLVYLLVFLTLLFMGLFLVPALIKQLNTLADAIPFYTTEIENFIRRYQVSYRRVSVPDNIREAIDATLSNLEHSLQATFRHLAGGLITLIKGMAYLILTPILTFYVLKDLQHFERKALRLLPRQYRGETLFLWRQIDKVMVNFVRGHLTVAALVGFLTFLGLQILGMEFALLLGIIAGLADLIPYFGPFIGAIPAVGLALLESRRLALYVVLVMLVVQQLEASVITPRVLGKNMELHPVVIVFALLAGGHLYGLIGIILAVPVAAILRLLVNFTFKKLA